MLPATGTLQPILMPPAQESTPLLRKAVSFSQDNQLDRDHIHIAGSHAKPRRVSTGSFKSARYEYTGKSTFGQTVSFRGHPESLY
jgi:hypothetical protein